MLTLHLRLHHTRPLLHHGLHATSVGLRAGRALLLNLRLQVRTEWNLTVLIQAALGVVPAEEYHLLANVALTVFAFAFFGVLNDAFVTETTSIDAIRVATVDGVQQRLDAPLHRLLPLQLRIDHRLAVRIRRVLIAVLDDGRHRTFHLVFMLRLGVVTLLAQIKIFAYCTMIADFALLPTRVAVVGELVRGGRVQFVEQSHGREPRATQRRELVVLVAREVQECIASVHEITLDQGIGIVNNRTRRVRVTKSDDEECLDERQRE